MEDITFLKDQLFGERKTKLGTLDTEYKRSLDRSLVLSISSTWYPFCFLKQYPSGWLCQKAERTFPIEPERVTLGGSRS